MNAYMNQYQQNQIMTASKEQILIMLYSGAIRFCQQAITAGQTGNNTEKLAKIAKVFAIVSEFSDSLNHEIGGEIAADLDGLYQFMMRELSLARKDTTGEHLQVVHNLLTDLRQTWSEAIEINRNELGVIAAKKSEYNPTFLRAVKHLSTAG